MAYVGQGIKNGTFSVLDTSGNTYNGSNTTFNLGTQVGSPAQLLVSHDGVIQKPVTDYTIATGGTQITFTTAPASGASIFITEISGAVGGPMNRDINGDELILDVDGDTSITADTDDQIDIRVAGTDQITIKDGAVSPVTDNDVDLGTTSLEFKDGYFDGTLHCDVLDLAGTEHTSISAGLTGIDDQSSSNDDQLTIADGEICINEDSDDLDFRIESNSNTHAFFLDGQHNSRITCGASAGENAGGYTSVFTVIQLDDNPAMSLQAKKNNDGGPSFVFVKSRNTAVGSFTSVANNDVLGGIRWAADDGGDTETQGGVIDCRVDGTPGANDMPTRMGLMVTPDGANSVNERFRISQNGDLTASDTSIGSLSDQRLKDNIKDYTYDLETFKKYKPRTFDWKNPVEHSGRTDNRGFIAQEIKTVDDYWTYEYEINKENADYSIIYNDDGSLKDGKKAMASKLDKTDAMYISVIQQLITKIETLETKVKALEDA